MVVFSLVGIGLRHAVFYHTLYLVFYLSDIILSVFSVGLRCYLTSSYLVFYLLYSYLAVGVDSRFGSRPYQAA